MNRDKSFNMKFPNHWTYTGDGGEGNPATATSAGAFNRFTQRLIINRPVLVSAIIWNIFTTQTYNLELVNAVTASPTILKTLASGVSLTGGASGTNNTITIPQTLFLPNIYFISLYCSTAVRQRRNGSQPLYYTIASFFNVGYDGGSGSTGTCPIKFVGHYYDYPVLGI